MDKGCTFGDRCLLHEEARRAKTETVSYPRCNFFQVIQHSHFIIFKQSSVVGTELILFDAAVPLGRFNSQLTDAQQ